MYNVITSLSGSEGKLILSNEESYKIDNEINK